MVNEDHSIGGDTLSTPACFSLSVLSIPSFEPGVVVPVEAWSTACLATILGL